MDIRYNSIAERSSISAIRIADQGQQSIVRKNNRHGRLHQSSVGREFPEFRLVRLPDRRLVWLGWCYELIAFAICPTKELELISIIFLRIGARLLLSSVCLFLVWTYPCGSSALGEEPIRSVVLNSNELNESSGVAQTGPVIWTHNDSGDVPRLFAFSQDGVLRGQFIVRGAQAIDWEDMCAFQRDGKRYLAVGDIGDNSAQRKSVRLYVIEIPEALLSEAPSEDSPGDTSEAPVAADTPRRPGSPQLADGSASGELTVQATFEVQYPTGPVNCEALAYDPLSQSFLLATKELILCRLYRVPAPTLTGTQAVQAEFMGSLILPLVTGGDISPDGKQLVLSTYGPGCLLQRHFDDQRQAMGWQTQGLAALHMFALPPRRQGESIGFSEDGQRLWLTSEGEPTPLYNIPVPKPGRL